MLKITLPFPDIARFEDEARLPGVPHIAEESAFHLPQLDTPELQAAMSDSQYFHDLSSTSGKRKFISERLSSLIMEPGRYAVYLRSLATLGSICPEKAEASQSCLKFFQAELPLALQNLLKKFSGDRYTPRSLCGWVDLWENSDDYRIDAETVLAGLAQNCHSSKESLDFLTALAVGTLGSPDVAVQMAGLRILLFRTNIIPRLGEAHRHLMGAAFAPDDHSLKQYYDLYTAATLMGQRLAPEALPIYESFEMISTISPADRQLLATSRSRIIADFDLENEVTGVNEDGLKQWPMCLLIKDSPLRRIINRFIVDNDPKLHGFSLPGRPNLIVRVDLESLDYVRSALLSGPSKFEPLNKPENLAALCLLTPPLSAAQRSVLAEDVEKLRGDIIRERDLCISPRGDEVRIADPGLSGLGFRTLGFSVIRGTGNIAVNISVGNCEFELAFNNHLVLVDTAAGEPIPGRRENRAFLEHFVLSHLYELLCTNRMRPDYDGAHPRDSIEGKRRFLGRRGHTQRLPPGYVFSPEAEALAWSESSIDLVQRNAELGLTREIGLKTYHGISEPDGNSEAGPITSQAPHAMDRLRTLFGGVFSDGNSIPDQIS